MRCTEIVESSGRRCVRQTPYGGKCYQHQKGEFLDFKVEDYVILGEYETKSKEDFVKFLDTIPSIFDKNKVILALLKKGKMVLPLMFFVGGLLTTFDDFESARKYIKATYEEEILPYVVEYILENGTRYPFQSETPRLHYDRYGNEKQDTVGPYGFSYYKSKPRYPGRPSAPMISYNFPQDDSDNYVKKDLEYLNDYIQKNTLLHQVLRRGDLLFNSSYQGELNQGLRIWNGRRPVALIENRTVNSYPFIPKEFHTLTEFPFGYFHGEPGIEYNTIQWMDLGEYEREAVRNYTIDEETENAETFITVEDVDRYIRLYLSNEAVDFTIEQLKTSLRGYKPYSMIYSSEGEYRISFPSLLSADTISSLEELYSFL